jgi:hypothetical protein
MRRTALAREPTAHLRPGVQRGARPDRLERLGRYEAHLNRKLDPWYTGSILSSTLNRLFWAGGLKGGLGERAPPRFPLFFPSARSSRVLAAELNQQVFDIMGVALSS